MEIHKSFGSPKGWNGSKIPPHTIGQGLFFPSLKGVNLTFRLVTKVAIFSYLWLRYKGLGGSTAHRFYLRNAKWFSRTQLVPRSLSHSAGNVHSYFCWIILLLMKKSNTKTKLAMPTERAENSPTCQLCDFGKIKTSVLWFPHLWDDNTNTYLRGLWWELIFVKLLKQYLARGLSLVEHTFLLLRWWQSKVWGFPWHGT